MAQPVVCSFTQKHEPRPKGLQAPQAARCGFSEGQIIATGLRQINQRYRFEGPDLGKGGACSHQVAERKPHEV